LDAVVAERDRPRVAVDAEPVEHPEVLEVDGVREQHPGIDGEVARLDRAEDEVGDRDREARHVEERRRAGEDPDEVPRLGARKTVEGHAARDAVGDRDARARAVRAVLPVMERAAEVVADHRPEGEVGTEVAAVGREHGYATALTAVDDHAAVEKLAGDDLPYADVAREDDRVPRLVVAVAALPGHGAAAPAGWGLRHRRRRQPERPRGSSTLTTAHHPAYGREPCRPRIRQASHGRRSPTTAPGGSSSSVSCTARPDARTTSS